MATKVLKKGNLPKSIREKIRIKPSLYLNFAIEMDMHPETIRKWLKEDYWRLSTRNSIRALTKILGVSEEELFDFEEEESSFKN